MLQPPQFSPSLGHLLLKLLRGQLDTLDSVKVLVKQHGPLFVVLSSYLR